MSGCRSCGDFLLFASLSRKRRGGDATNFKVQVIGCFLLIFADFCFFVERSIGSSECFSFFQGEHGRAVWIGYLIEFFFFFSSWICLGLPLCVDYDSCLVCCDLN